MTWLQALERVATDAAAALDGAGARAALDALASSGAAGGAESPEQQRRPGLRNAAATAASKLQRPLKALAAVLAAAGQAQLLRRRLAFELHLLSTCAQRPHESSRNDAGRTATCFECMHQRSC